jgi:hypothetical protein
MNLPTENQNPFMRNIMEQGRINEVNVDNLIPFDKTKTEVYGRKEHLINRTISKLDDYLSRISKFPLKDVKDFMNYGDGVWEEDGSGVFDRFYIGYTREGWIKWKKRYQSVVYFTYCKYSKCYELHHNIVCDEGYSNPNPLQDKIGSSECISIPKDNIKTKLSRQKTSISLTKQILSKYVTKTKMEEFFQSRFCIFSKENIILWE